MRPIVFFFGLFCLSTVVCNTSLQAQIYDISSLSGIGSNNVNSGTGPTLVDNMDGTFDFSSATNSGNSNAVFIASSDGGTVSALNGGLTATDSVVVSLTVDSFDGNIVGNGFEFGIQSGTGFRSDPNWLLQIDDAGNAGGGAPNFAGAGNVNRTDTPGATEASLNDGFSVEAIYDVNGITYNVSDILTAGGADSFSFTYTAADIANLGGTYDFLTDVGGGFAYFSHQTSAGGVAETAVISEFSISVPSAVPEPSSTALIVLCGSLLSIRRRR